MADKELQRWYPPPGHSREDTDRIIFDNIYELQDQQKDGAGQSNTNTAQAMSGTVVIGGNFSMGGKTFTQMTFADGKLVAVA